MADNLSKHPGRPRQHPSGQHRTAAYMRRAAGEGLVRVSVMVPAGRASDLLTLAAAMRESSRRTRSGGAVKKPVQPQYPSAGAHWTNADDASLLRVWGDGGTALEIVSGLGRPLEEILHRLVLLEEVGSTREAQAEFDARARADKRAGGRLRKS